MSGKLLAYLVATLALTVAAGVMLHGIEEWHWGLLAWFVSAFLAWLLYGEQKGHPLVLLIPTLLLGILMALKAYSAN